MGERLITSRTSPVFDGVYKLVAVEERGEIVPRIKVSENVGKITNPHYKRLYRFYGRESGMAEADYIAVYDEAVDDTKDLVIRDPDATWKQKTMTNFRARELQVPIFKGGELVYKLPSLPEIQAYCKARGGHALARGAALRLSAQLLRRPLRPAAGHQARDAQRAPTADGRRRAAAAP